MVSKNQIVALLYSKNIPMLMGKPGVGKSAIASRIAKENNWDYIDLRLAQKDEAEIGGLPFTTKMERYTITEYALPGWFHRANSAKERGFDGCLIHFEELNRCTPQVRNACLGILNERIINDAKFADNVYMIASGNLGEEDGTEVEELTTETVNRLVMLKYEPTMKEWIDDYAKENVHPTIVRFLEDNPTHYYKFKANATNKGKYDKMEDGYSIDSFATPRTWTNLSNYIKTLEKNIYKRHMTNKDIIKEVRNDVGLGFVGISAKNYVEYLIKTDMLTIQDVIDRFDDYVEDIKALNKSERTRLMKDLQETDEQKLSDEQIQNVIKFLKVNDSDEVSAYLLFLMDEKTGLAEDIPAQIITIFKSFKKELQLLQDAQNAQ